MSLVNNGLSSLVLSEADPRYLVDIQSTIKKLNKLELSDSEIEWLFLNPAHELYHENSKRFFVGLVELELKEDNTVDVLSCGNSVDKKPLLAGSRESLDHQMDKSVIHPITVDHWVMDIDVLNSFRVLLNNEPDFKVLLYRVARRRKSDDRVCGWLSIQVRDFEINKLEEYADRIYSILGASCASVNYHSFEVYIYSPKYYFHKGFPTTKCGLIIDKIAWDGFKYKKTQNEASVFCAYLQNNNCSNFRVLDDNPEFWKITFETPALWGDNLYNKMWQDGLSYFRLFSEANDSGFINDEYPRTRWKIVSVRRRSDMDDEETVMKALSSGNGEPYGRD